MALASDPPRIAYDESGLTLVELLVVMRRAVIVALALFTFQDLDPAPDHGSSPGSTRPSEARIAIEKIESRLHSSCVAEGVTPILDRAARDDQPRPSSASTARRRA